VLTGAVGKNGDRLEDAIGVVTLGLLGRTAVEAPARELFQGRELVEVLDEGFAADVGDGLVAVEPYVFQFELGHGCLLLVSICAVSAEFDRVLVDRVVEGAERASSK